jgi:glyoxylase-like metal-dependent hydrolase (beta-lactamase superfamily II)
VIFTLEALRADQGDCLLLHYGPRRRPLVAVIDGGPSGVYKRTLRPRLEELRASRSPDAPLQLQLVAVSHIDDDHVRGVLDLVEQLAREEDDDAEQSYEILGLWHNSFEDVVGGTGRAGVPAAVSALGTDAGAHAAGLSEPARLVVASIAQGRRLRDTAAALALDVNNPFDGPVVAPRTVDWGDGLDLTVVGPDRDRLADLQRRWEQDVRGRRPSEATVAAYLDRSVFNLSSIVILAEFKRKRMLLTGDARGDDILAGLRSSGLLDRPPLHVDILKLPHHGSDRNVETEFFRQVVADHYVVSADGTDDNPEIATFEMISGARDDDDFVLHLTHSDGKNALGRRLKSFERKERRSGRRYEIRSPADSEPSLKIDLLDGVSD